MPITWTGYAKWVFVKVRSWLDILSIECTCTLLCLFPIDWKASRTRRVLINSRAFSVLLVDKKNYKNKTSRPRSV